MNNLNPAQAQAARHIDGPLLILAGAGTGKTQTMISRLVYLISQVGIPDENILVLTFTNKAAASMNARAQRMLANAGFAHANRAILSTFHSWGMNFLSEFIAECPYRAPNFRIIDDGDRKDLIKECARKALAIEHKDPYFAQKQPNKSASELKEQKELLKDLNINARAEINRFKNTLKTKATELVANVIKLYEAELVASNMLDFDDLILIPLRMLSENNQLRSYIQQRHQYIMVDEYQDTNIAQLHLLKLLAGEAKNIVVVGDDDQSIYSFRHATVENILNFEQDFPGAKIIRLEQNYRSTKTILKAANTLIAHNQMRHGKTLFSELEDGEQIESLASLDELIYNIEQLLLNGTKPEQIAVIYRLNMMANFLEPKLISKGIKYHVIGQIAFFLRAEIKLLLSYLRLWLDKNDNQSFIKIINAPKRGFGEAALLKLKQLANTQQNPSLFHTLALNLNSFSRATQLKEFIDLFNPQASFAVFKNKLNNLNIEELFEDPTNRREHINEFFKMLDESYSEPNKLAEFLNQIALASSSLDKHSGGINLLSIHAAKGLEFEYVFIAGAESKYMPSPQANSNELEEERRLMYVAITRAKKKLFLQFDPLCPSQYLSQMSELSAAPKAPIATKIPKLLSATLMQFKDHLCFHEIFGAGIINHILGANKLMIEFSQGIKTIDAAFVRISPEKGPLTAQKAEALAKWAKTVSQGYTPEIY